MQDQRFDFTGSPGDPAREQCGWFCKRGPFFIFGRTINSRLLQNEIFSNTAEACKFTVAIGKGAHRAQGVLNPLRLTEEQFYAALCGLREMGSGATSAQHMIEALFFLEGTAKLTLVDIRAVISGRCRGVAKDMYLKKNPSGTETTVVVETRCNIWRNFSMRCPTP